MFRFGKFAVLVVALSCFGCATPPGNGETVEVVVKGTQTTVKAFDQALQLTLSGYVVGCIGCDQLGTVDSLTYSFFRSQLEVYERFGLAWNSVVPPVGETKPQMTFLSTPVAFDCTGPAHPQCYDLTPCIQYSRCTADSSLHSCKKCP